MSAARNIEDLSRTHKALVEVIEGFSVDPPDTAFQAGYISGMINLYRVIFPNYFDDFEEKMRVIEKIIDDYAGRDSVRKLVPSTR